MIPNYQVRFKNTSGAVTHVLAGAGAQQGGLSRVHVESVVNGSGSHVIDVRGDLSIADEIGLDYQVEVWRRPAGLTSWARVYEGLHRRWDWKADSDGNELFESTGVGYNALLSRRIIAYYATSAEAYKSGNAETVIKQYVNENLGPGAAAGRQLTGLTVQTDGGGGSAWEGDRAWCNLLEVCQDVAYAGGGDFQVVGTGPATFEFRWYTGQLGTDRTMGNVAGVDPIVFSLQRNNMLTPLLTLDYLSEFNTCYVLGPGDGLTRTVVAVYNTASVNYSPWNLTEVARQATGETTVQGLAISGAEALKEGLAEQSITFDAVQTYYSAYGIHYGLGDIITALFHQRVDKKISKVMIDVDDDQDSIKLELVDVIR